MKVRRRLRFRAYLYLANLLIIFLLTEGLYSQQIKDTTLTLYYNTASYKLDLVQLAHIRSFITSIDSVKEIIGYADSIGTAHDNKRLSQLRALNVLNIISPGIDSKPLCSYKGEDFHQNFDLSLNRKVEIIAYKHTNKPAPGFVSSIEVVDSFNIDHINFVPDRAILTQESFYYIPTLVKKVKSYQNANFEIIGHVNYQSKRDSSYLDDLYKLSRERAKIIYEILIENGVSKDLLRYEGVGNSQPLISDPKSDEERMKNMRVQILTLRAVNKQ